MWAGGIDRERERDKECVGDEVQRECAGERGTESMYGSIWMSAGNLHMGIEVFKSLWQCMTGGMSE